MGKTFDDYKVENRDLQKERAKVKYYSSPMSIPIIHLNDPDEAKSVRSLRKCCIEHGFFYLGGHDMEDLFPIILQESARLFALPISYKRTLYNEKMSRGYTGMEEETLDPSNQTRGDTKEGFYIGKDIPSHHPNCNPAKLKGPNIWPSQMNDSDSFQKSMDSYFQKASEVALKVVQLLALAIGLSNKHALDSCFTEQFASIRLLHYAPVKSNPPKGILACGAHSDYGMLTLLLTDENPGLQILTQTGEWLDVPPKSLSDGYFIVNLGDMLERWTNGIFRSTVHRVITNGTNERYSVPFFYEPDFDTKVECLEVCCSQENPPKYPPTTSGQHLLDKYKQTHADFQPQI
jgi:isopenicillin N synthase-like dioxygenase